MNHPTPPRAVALNASQVIAGLAQLAGWKLHGDGTDVAIEKSFHFKTHLHTFAFVNTIAFLAECHNHHPELLVRGKYCSVRFNTHDVQGLSQADFAAAAAIDALQQEHGGTL